ncbi:hypothetical protein BLNAU_9502 [Blattamonas nauphoetae]|uniref:Uncharacterized protein n=1 Tax=Blattamonas nauphoetae TaxID=2049346 RepID=A0ABQ9XVE5_9EUKA|nr:hypothetical protein BLNAU_9502 [Blattamonas nauphoetae]
MQEPFLVFDPTTELSFDEKSRIYCSLVTLVKAEFPFDDALEDRAAQFLKSVTPRFGKFSLSTKLVTDLVPSSTGSPSGFVESIFTLLSSPHSTLVAATLSLLRTTTWNLSTQFQCRLVESDIITNALATVQPHTLPITGFEETHSYLIRIIDLFVDLASASSLRNLRVTTAAIDKSNHREMIFQKVVTPSSPFVTFLITNRNSIDGDFFESFMYLLNTFIKIAPFHLPTLEFVLVSPIVMAFSSCLSFVEDDNDLLMILTSINNSLPEWKKEGREVVQYGKRMMQALFSEGFENTLEQILIHETSEYSGFRLSVVSFLEPRHKQPSKISESKQLQTTLLVIIGLSLQIAVHSSPNDGMDSTTPLAQSELEWTAISFLCWIEGELHRSSTDPTKRTPATRLNSVDTH